MNETHNKAGESSTYYNVMIYKDDDTDEGNENFYLAPTGYAIADNQVHRKVA
ncbi:MAG: hypothetical protein AB7S65_13125 [Sulfuricurvum sp.]